VLTQNHHSGNKFLKHPTLGDLEKYFIYYYGGVLDGLKEYYSRSLETPETEIRTGYIKHEDSL